MELYVCESVNPNVHTHRTLHTGHTHGYVPACTPTHPYFPIYYLRINP